MKQALILANNMNENFPNLPELACTGKHLKQAPILLLLLL